MENIVERKKCSCWCEFNIADWDMELIGKISPSFNWIKYLIPTPTLCPACREQRRLAWRNERNIYRTTSHATWKNILSIYSPDKPFKVFEKAEYLSDRWNALDYWREYDFSRSFFEQFDELLKDVPKMALTQENSENSDYTNRTWNVKDCYLSFITWESVNSHYIYWSMFTDDSLDCGYIMNSQLCYECLDAQKCHNLQFSQNCKNCSNSKFLLDCDSCDNCFGCVWLRNKSFCLYNEELSKERYQEEIAKIKITHATIPNIKTQLKEVWANMPVNFYIWTGNDNVSWNYINNSKNCIHCFDAWWESGMEDCKYCTDGGFGMSNCMDSTHWAINYTYAYDCLGSMDWTVTMANIDCWWGTNFSYYCSYCSWINNCFGCTGIRNAQFCILNKQYSQEEYEAIVPKIIENMIRGSEWWEFFPMNISPFGYNETVAMEYYPIERRDAINRVSTDGKATFNWSTYENPRPEVSKIIPAAKLPADIEEIPDDILNWAIDCEVTGKPFRIIKQELEFYRKHSLPIPKRHPDQRHLDRISLRNPRILYDRKCDSCEIDIRTTYPPDWHEIVYCGKCYNEQL